MSFKIRYVDGYPQWDALPVASLRHFPFTEDDYKPYTQFRLCFLAGKGLLVRGWAFENLVKADVFADSKEPLLTDSCLSIAMNFYPETSGKALLFTMNKNNVIEAMVFGDGKPAQRIPFVAEVKEYQGEDNQGIFWSREFLIPTQLLQTTYGQNDIRPGNRLTGNLYKIKLDDTPHFGCYYEMAGAKPTLTDLSSFGEFLITEY